MRLLLVDNLVMPEAGSSAQLDLHPHLGLLALAAAAEADGHGVRIYDPKREIVRGTLPLDASLYDRAAGAILAERPDAVGFTTLGASFLFAANTAAALKRREPELPILLGGPHATMLHREMLERFGQFDIVVRHEADEIFGAVLAKLETRRFDAIPGLSWRVSAQGALRFTEGKPIVEDLDRLPLVSYDHYPVAELGLDLLRIEAGRGCPFACTFCSTATFFQRSFRLKSAFRLVAELERLRGRYGFSDFKLDHDLFTVNRRKVLEFCDAVAGRGFRWRASARVDCVDAELLRRMAESGCVSLYFGIETGSARMQEIARKRLDLALVEPTLRIAEALGIETTASFITGYPEEEEPDQDASLDLIGRCLSPACLPQLHVLAPEPGTALFQRWGKALRYDGEAGPYNASPVAAGDAALIRAHPDLFSTYHHYPGALPRARALFAADAMEVLRRLGPILLAYMLRAFGGRLSALVRELRLWAERNGRDRADADLVESYVAASFGARHPVAALVRYALAVNAPAPEPFGAAAPPRRRRFDPARRYRLDRRWRILSDMPDCAALLARLADGKALDGESAAGERGTYLIGPASQFRLAEGAEAILGLFDRPRRCRDIAAHLRRHAGISGLDAGFFAGLVDAGILVAARHAPKRRAHA